MFLRGAELMMAIVAAVLAWRLWSIYPIAAYIGGSMALESVVSMFADSLGERRYEAVPLSEKPE